MMERKHFAFLIDQLQHWCWDEQIVITRSYANTIVVLILVKIAISNIGKLIRNIHI